MISAALWQDSATGSLLISGIINQTGVYEVVTTANLLSEHPSEGQVLQYEVAEATQNEEEAIKMLETLNTTLQLGNAWKRLNHSIQPETFKWIHAQRNGEPIYWYRPSSDPIPLEALGRILQSAAKMLDATCDDLQLCIGNYVLRFHQPSSAAADTFDIKGEAAGEITTNQPDKLATLLVLDRLFTENGFLGLQFMQGENIISLDGSRKLYQFMETYPELKTNGFKALALAVELLPAPLKLVVYEDPDIDLGPSMNF